MSVDVKDVQKLDNVTLLVGVAEAVAFVWVWHRASVVFAWVSESKQILCVDGYGTYY